MLHAAFVRSPHAHAAIRGIDKSAALALPGVKAVLTLDDLRPWLAQRAARRRAAQPSYRQERNRPALAGDETVHVGEPVAIVVADDRYIAEDAVALVAVDYEPLPAVVDCRAALEPGAPRVHRDAPHNLLAEFAMGYGDVDARVRRRAARVPGIVLAAPRRQPFDRMPRRGRGPRRARGQADAVVLDADAARPAARAGATCWGATRAGCAW